MSKAPCCWASNAKDRDKENYIRCSTRQKPQTDKKGKPDKNMCCGPAFRLKQAKDAERDIGDEIDKKCGPRKKGQKKIKIDKDDLRCFTANMICMKLNMPGQVFDCPPWLRINAKICKGCNPVMCADRINVNCMPVEPSAQFAMLPECLDKALNEGITISVRYKNKEIGRGCYVMPDSYIVRIIESTEEVVHTAQVELTCKGCTVGMCTVRLSMTMRCPELPEIVMDTDVDLCRDGDDNEDSCFGASSGSATSSDPCRGFVSADEPSEDSNGACSSAKMRARGGGEQEKLIDAAGPFNVYTCPKEDDGCLNIRALSGPGRQFAVGTQSHLGDGNVNRVCPPTAPPPLEQFSITRGKECPMCHEDIHWLPKIAACPHCGYKPVPHFEVKTYDEEATAQDVILDYFHKEGMETDENSGSNHCTHGGSDARSEEAIDAIVNNYKALQQSLKKSLSRSGEVCKNAATKKQKPPNLVSIFTEMKKLYEGSSEEALKKQKLKDICDEASKACKPSRKHRACQPPVIQAPQSAKRKRKPARRLGVKSRLYAPVGISHPHESHERCFGDSHRVPAHMGWMWTNSPLAKRPGWKPGAIRRSIRELMSYFLRDFPVDSVPISKYLSYQKQKQQAADEGVVHEKAEDLVQVPTLHIEKKNDEYLITLRPLKDAETLKRAANPYVNMKPVQFRIIKNPVLKQVRDMKRCLKKMGHSKCTCHRPVMECYCRSFIDKKQLVQAVRKECKERDLPNCEYELILSDTTDSEAEFDFGVTPPAGLMRPERLKVSHTMHSETQYNENDWAQPTMFPHPPNPFVQYGACVLGERKDKFPWIFGKGFVHEEPKPPKMRNMPKKKPKKPAPGTFVKSKPAPPAAPKAKPADREKGGCNTDTRRPQATPQPAQRHSKDSQSYGERLDRISQAARPPTAKHFQRRPSKTSVKMDSRRQSPRNNDWFST